MQIPIRIATSILVLLMALTPSLVMSQVEISFSIPSVSGNPFDYIQNDVKLVLEVPGGKRESYPAFFDGGTNWKVRLTPRSAGMHRVLRVERNGGTLTDVAPVPTEFSATTDQVAPFVRVDPSHPTQFSFTNGSPYYPVGNNAAWSAGTGQDVVDYFRKMAAAGENWSRVWMCHWDGKNLDWPQPAGGEGYHSLPAARHWDDIVRSADKLGIRFQMTLQHHGQYSTMVDPNWGENPWNKKNGGFLAKPEEFFTDMHARALTRARYRYIVARYGWSPAIMAWELFNEVEGTDAARMRNYAPISAWHEEMAAFIRSQDPFHHLITTSSDMKILGLFDAMDYLQPHSYSPDPMATIASIKPLDYGKPVFLGEIGPATGGRNDAPFVSSVLWASLVSDNSGSAQYWFWDRMIGQDLFKTYDAFNKFVKASGVTEHHDLKSVTVAVKSAAHGSFSFGPGGGWGNAATTRFVIDGQGPVKGAGSLPSFFQGKAHREMFPELKFDVNYPVAGEFTVAVGTVAKSGASLSILVDGKQVAQQEFAPTNSDSQVNKSLTAVIPKGSHQLELQNNGADWVSISRFSLAPYGTAFHALAKTNDTFAILWIYSAGEKDPPISAGDTVELSGMRSGKYQIRWFDTATGAEIASSKVDTSPGGILAVGPPKGTRSAAAYLVRLL